jgi:hypothetical protein
MAFDGVIRGTAVAIALAAAASGCSHHSSQVKQSGNGGGQGRTPSGASKAWGTPILADDFGGTQLDASKWQVYEAPDAATHRGIAAGTHVSGGKLMLVGGLYDDRDQGAGVISRLSQMYGRWEARIRSDPGAGYSATAFLWPMHMGNPEYAEIDFAEILSANRHSGGLFLRPEAVHDAAVSPERDAERLPPHVEHAIEDHHAGRLDPRLPCSVPRALTPPAGSGQGRSG